MGFLPLAYLGWPVRPGTWAEGPKPPGGLASVPAEVPRALPMTQLTDGTQRQVPLQLHLISPPNSQCQWSIHQPLFGGVPLTCGQPSHMGCWHGLKASHRVQSSLSALGALVPFLLRPAARYTLFRALRSPSKSLSFLGPQGQSSCPMRGARDAGVQPCGRHN